MWKQNWRTLSKEIGYQRSLQSVGVPDYTATTAEQVGMSEAGAHDSGAGEGSTEGAGVDATVTEAPSSEQSSTSGGMNDSILKSLLSSTKFKDGLIPSFNYSDRLSNHINAENELLARQLTLLRNEVGPGQTIVFLELPHSVHSVPGRSDGKQVQVHWQVTGLCDKDPYEDVAGALAYKYVRELKNRAGSLANNGSFYSFEEFFSSEKSKKVDSPKLDLDAVIQETITTLARKRHEELKQALAEKLSEENVKSLALPQIMATMQDEVDEVWGGGTVHQIQQYLELSILENDLYGKLACQSGESDKDKAVAWDLIPRTNAYNVADFNFEKKDFSLIGIFSLLTGIGADARYKRRKELFEQFAIQDIFASSYGQGEAAFGWVYNPRPGSKRVASGSKSTYAALIVPIGTTVIKMKAYGCVLGRKEPLKKYDLQGDKAPIGVEEDDTNTGDEKKNTETSKVNDKKCSLAGSYHLAGNKPDTKNAGNGSDDDGMTFDIALHRDKGFWLEKIDYVSVAAGEVASLEIDGRGFSPFQTSILVDGHPLERFNGLKTESREVARQAAGNSDKPEGNFEVLNSRRLLINFRMPANYVGTPEIRIVTPRRVRALNGLSIVGRAGDRMRSRPLMFQKPLSVANVIIDDVSGRPDKRFLTLQGEGFRDLCALNLVSGGGLEKVVFERNYCFKSDSEKKASARILSDEILTLTVGNAAKWTVFLSKKIGGKESRAMKEIPSRRNSGELSLTEGSFAEIKARKPENATKQAAVEVPASDKTTQLVTPPEKDKNKKDSSVKKPAEATSYVLTVKGTGFEKSVMDVLISAGGGEFIEVGPKTKVKSKDKGEYYQVVSSAMLQLTTMKAGPWKLLVRRPGTTPEDVAMLEIKPKAKDTRLAISAVKPLRLIPKMDKQNYAYEAELQVTGKNFPKDVKMTVGQNKGAVVADSLKRVSATEVRSSVQVSAGEFMLLMASADGKQSASKLVTLPTMPLLKRLENDGVRGEKRACGYEGGGETITLTGQNLKSVTKVLFGEKTAQIIFQDEKELKVSSPPGSGKVMVSLLASAGTGAKASENIVLKDLLQFSYSPKKGCARVWFK